MAAAATTAIGVRTALVELGEEEVTVTQAYSDYELLVYVLEKQVSEFAYKPGVKSSRTTIKKYEALKKILDTLKTNSEQYQVQTLHTLLKVNLYATGIAEQTLWDCLNIRRGLFASKRAEKVFKLLNPLSIMIKRYIHSQERQQEALMRRAENQRRQEERAQDIFLKLEQKQGGKWVKYKYDTMFAEIKQEIITKSKTTDAPVDVQIERMEKLSMRIYSDLVKFFYLERYNELDEAKELQILCMHLFAGCLGIDVAHLVECAKTIDKPSLQVFSLFNLHKIGVLSLIKECLLPFVSFLGDQSLKLDFHILSGKVLPVLRENIGKVIPCIIASSTIVDESVKEQIAGYILFAFKAEVYDPYRAQVSNSIDRGMTAAAVVRTVVASLGVAESKRYEP